MTSGSEIKESLRLNTQISRMMADPDCTGDLLLFSLGLLNVIMETKLAGRVKPKRSSQFARVTETTGLSAFACKHVIGKDVPRYEPPPYTYTCVAPMIRRDGPCGKRAMSSWVDRDPLTGAATWIGYCSRHFTLDLQRAGRDRTQQWITQGKPTPPANTGGVLPRYFNTNWDRMYAWAAPWRVPSDQAPDPTPPRPVFRLIQGEAS